MRILVTLFQIIVAIIAILALVLWEKRDKNTNWLLSLCLLIPMLIIPQIFEDSDNYAMCMYSDDERKEDFLHGQYDRLVPPQTLDSEPVVTTSLSTDSMSSTESVGNEVLASYRGLGHRNWFYDTSRNSSEPPRLHRSDLMPVPQQDLSLWAPLGDVAADIGEGKIEILRQIEENIPQGKPVYYGLALPIPTSANEFILMYDSLFRTKANISLDITHLHLNIDTNQRLIEQCNEILNSIDQNEDLLREVGIEPTYVDQQLEKTKYYMDSAVYYHHKYQYGQDLSRTFWPNASENNDPNKFTSHPGYNPVARRLKAFAIIAAVSGLTYKACDFMFFV
jgi:hypothetical protein